MMGTFAAMLAKQRIPTPEDRFQAKVSGMIEAVDGVLKITRIAVHYHLKIAADRRMQAEDCFAAYLPGCPAAQSVMGCIDIEHTLKMVDL